MSVDDLEFMTEELNERLIESIELLRKIPDAPARNDWLATCLNMVKTLSLVAVKQQRMIELLGQRIARLEERETRRGNQR